MLQDYTLIAVLIGIACMVTIGGLITSRMIQTRKASPEKELPYECGIDPVGKSWIQFKASYYLYALVFVVFDVETMFLYPWAVKFQQLGLFGFMEMIVFVGILALGLWYAWKKGALEWK